LDNATLIAVFLIGAKDPRKEFEIRAQSLVDSGSINREEIPKLLDEICKMKGNAGEIGREIREELKKEG
jgi:hypothetical protein